MSKQSPSTAKFQVGRYRCTMTFADGAISSKWEPKVPRDLNKAEVKAYRKGRDALLAQTGKKILMVEF